MADHLLHFDISPDWMNFTISCEHAPDSEEWAAREDEGDGEVIEPRHCWVQSWVEAEGCQTYWLSGHWPTDPPSPCPVEISWNDGPDVECASSVFAEQGA